MDRRRGVADYRGAHEARFSRELRKQKAGIEVRLNYHIPVL
jgi:hypothetical protein